MRSSDVHLMLVSAQAAPNLLPVLSPELRPKEAILLVSAPMAERGEALAGVLRSMGIRASIEPLRDEHDRAALQDTMLDLAAKREGQRLALNVTGGTKLMALSAQSIAIEAGWDVFYVDLDTGCAIGLHPEDWRLPLQNNPSLAQYLAAYGFRRDKAESVSGSSRHDELIAALLLDIGSHEQALGQLNALCSAAAHPRNRLAVQLTPEQQDSVSLLRLLDLFHNAGLLQRRGSKLQFASEEARALAGGGWLEQQVHQVVGRHRDALGLRDVSINVQVVDHNGLRNELDVAFMANNRLHVIECKTARMDDPTRTKANDSLFKIAEVCRRVGGLGTRGMLASYRRLAPAEQRLATALNIELACGPELARFGERLRAWVTRP